jgi:hypothetical protein
MFPSKNLIPTTLLQPVQEESYFFSITDATNLPKAVSTPLKAQNLYFKF